ncbi:MAG TPA: ribulose-phosphate 3-epimerase [Candidatus Dormibacteraeota bacterium]|jgi:ribulose-phosphate 3-epimerase|nr:ribulose-phosphate 3-epimerase [Candidatus Dormibacteraeota bacterium]
MKHRVAIEPSILSADFARLGEQAKEAEEAGADGIQIDVMDGHFVPNLTFGPGVVKALRKSVNMFLDAHLMIDNPGVFLEEFARAGANRIIVHQEVCKDLRAVVQSIRTLHVEAGVALNPRTSIETVGTVFGLADCFQVMTVNPGFAGQRFMEDQLSKIQRLRHELDLRRSNASIVVDGGIDPKTAPLAVKAGATVLVAGSSIYNQSASVAENLRILRRSVDNLISSVRPSALP